MYSAPAYSGKAIEAVHRRLKRMGLTATYEIARHSKSSWPGFVPAMTENYVVGTDSDVSLSRRARRRRQRRLTCGGRSRVTLSMKA